jgi:enoyl-CoA hydratase/carnithine racemase
MNQERVQLEVAAGVAEVRLARPDKSNSLDQGMFEALVATGRRLTERRDVRAVVLSGEGQGFCAGIDLGLLSDKQAGISAGLDDLPRRTHGDGNLFQYAVMVWRDLPVPVIAAVHGFALGGGFQLALGADMRHATADTRFALKEIAWGLVPDMGATVLLKHLIREDLMRELCFTGRTFSGSEAFEIGLVTGLSDDPRQSALALAREIAANSPDAVRAVKRLLNMAPTASRSECLLAESLAQQALVGSPNQMETLIAAREKRPPRFVD